MNVSLKLLSRELLNLVKIIGQEADCSQVPVFLVGGIVRDIFLKRPNLDLDIVVETDSFAFVKILSQRLNVKPVFHKEFMTATLFYKAIRIDIAQARKEVYPTPGSLPIVSQGQLKDDLFRRDFTINAMAICLNKNKLGELVDPFDGLADLKNGLIRVLYHQSFKDDPTRIYRAVRFEQRFNFHLKPQTLKLLKVALKKKFIENVNSSRIFAEFKKILNEKNPQNCLARLEQLKLYGFILIRFKYKSSSILKLQRSLKAYPASLINCDLWFIYFLVFIDNLAGRNLESVAQKFHFKREEKKAILDGLLIKGLRNKFIQGSLKRSEIFKALGAVSIERTLVWFYLEENSKIKKDLYQYLFNDSKVVVQTTGDDLKKLGIKQGKEIGVILDQILCLKIDGKIKTKQDELRFAKTFLD